MLEIMKSKEILFFILGLSLLFFYDGLTREPVPEENDIPLVIYHIDDDTKQYSVNID